MWLPVVLFGVVGQLAWVIENMYFATFAQNLFQDTSVYGPNTYYVATTLMVILSAITATASTIFAGGLCDKTGKRKPFIAFGYIIWGVTIMLFAAIPIGFDASKTAGVVAMLVLFDCIMTFFGSTANDAAFNTWLTDVTDSKNRGRINAVLSIMPVLAMVLAILVAMFTFDAGFDRTDPVQGFIAGKPIMYKLFFIIMGIIPMIAGVIAAFTLKDSPNIVKDSNPGVLKETFYGFRKDVIKSNKMLYVTLAAMCIIGISQQVFMSYLMNFIQKTLEIEGAMFFGGLGGVIVGAAIFTGIIGMLSDKIGRKHFYFPLIGIVIAGTLLIFLMRFMPHTLAVNMTMVIIAGTLMMGSLFSLNGALMSSFQDYIPTGTEGRFQGVRMCFTVLIPMIIGPIIALIIGMNTFSADDAAAIAKPDYWMFLASSIVAVFAIIPLIFVYKDSDRLRKHTLEKLAEEKAAETANEPELEDEDYVLPEEYYIDYSGEDLDLHLEQQNTTEPSVEPAADSIEPEAESLAEPAEEPATEPTAETADESAEEEPAKDDNKED